MRWRERPLGLRARLSIGLAALAGLMLLAQAALLLFVFDDREEAFIDAMLERQMAYSLARWPQAPAAALPNTPDLQLYWQDARQPAAPPLPPLCADLSPGSHERHAAGHEYHILRRARDGVEFCLTYDVADHERRWHALVQITLASLLAFCLLIVLAGHLLAGRLAAGLERLADRLAQDDPRSLVEPGMDRELRAVAEALAADRARQAAIVDRERAFAANLSHELRTPLTALRTEAELLTALPDLPPAVVRRGQRILAGVDRMTALASSLLTLARKVEVGQRRACPLHACIEREWQWLGQAGAAAATLVCTVPETVQVQADPQLLGLVLRNLFDNARRHSTGGTVHCTLTGSVLRVRDAGTGFSPEVLPHLFERFHAGDAGGTGIGLALVRQTAEASGWQVSAGNAPEGGGCVAIDFGPSLLVG